MKNPCDICLIKTMCGSMCSNKFEYGKYWQKQLESLCKNHFYTSGGNKRNEKFIKPEILELRKKVVERLDTNRTEILTILLREHGTFEE